MRPLLLAALCVACVADGQPRTVQLVVAASDVSPAAIARRAQALAPSLPGSLVVQTSDCGERKNVFALATVATSADEAQAALASTRRFAADAYLKRCDVKPGSLLALRLPAVDLSIAQVPATAVNWDDEDRVSSLATLEHGPTLYLQRYFSDAGDDPLEGRRVRVIVPLAGGRRVLEDSCFGFASPAALNGQVAFQCAREEAGEQVLHTVMAFDAAGNRLAAAPRCREPRWVDEHTVSCSEESVGPDGTLQLRAKRIELSSRR
jgi:hypothetical protein